MNYKAILMERFGYKEYEAELTIEDINEMDEESKEMLKKYFAGNDIWEYACGDFSVYKLHNNYGFNVIASILAISNLKKDYNLFSQMYNSGIK